jgi:hypothetical protein
MKTYFELPAKYHLIGWVILVIFIPFGIASMFNEWQIDFLQIQVREESSFFKPKYENFTNEILGIGVLIGLLMICLARLKEEDEFTRLLRLRSWQRGMTFNTILIILSFLFLYQDDFFLAAMFHLFTPLILVYMTFRFSILSLNRSIAHEK